MKKVLALTVMCVFIFALVACGSAAPKPTTEAAVVAEQPTAEQVVEEQPTEMPTEEPTVAPTETPVPPQPTEAPSFTDIVVKGITLRLGDVVKGVDYINAKGNNFFAPDSIYAGKTNAYVIFSFPGGIEEKALKTLANWKVWLVTTKGYKINMGLAISHMEPQPEVIWMFAVPKTTDGFVLNFPSGESIDLTPYLVDKSK